MISQELLRDNEFIGKFIGVDTTFSETIYKTSSDCPLRHLIDNLEKGKLQFDSSWEWLMPVLDKITELGYVIKTLSSPTISGQWISHTITIKTNGFNSETIAECKSDYSNNEFKISTYFRTIIEFLKYRENKVPQYEHDCNSCIFLGRYNEYDLYYCNEGNETVIARYGNNGQDYKSGLYFASTDEILFEAKRRASIKGLLKS